jgi:hypothetical protein
MQSPDGSTNGQKQSMPKYQFSHQMNYHAALKDWKARVEVRVPF